MMSDIIDAHSPLHSVDDDCRTGDKVSANQDCKDEHSDDVLEEEASPTGDGDRVLIHFREILLDEVSGEHVMSLLGLEKSRENSAIEDCQ